MKTKMIHNTKTVKQIIDIVTGDETSIIRNIIQVTRGIKFRLLDTTNNKTFNIFFVGDYIGFDVYGFQQILKRVQNV